jgi:hypothetical protein
MNVKRTLSIPLIALLAVLAFSATPALAAAPETPEALKPNPIGATSATFRGVINPLTGTGRVSYRFEYTEGGVCAGAATAPALAPFPQIEGNHEEVAVPVTGLEASTSYSVCLVAANPAEEAELTESPSVVFMTLPSQPLVTHESTSTPTPSGMTLQAEVNPENQQTELCTFEYGATVAYGKVTPCEPSTLAGSSVQTVTAHLKSLESGQTLHWRVAVRNATGEAKGADQSVTAEAPIVGVGSENVSAITPFTAHVAGMLNPNYQGADCGFQYWTTIVAEKEVSCEPNFLEGFGEQAVAVTLSGLEANQTYHYRIHAQNLTGEGNGAEETFKTLALEAPIFAS